MEAHYPDRRARGGRCTDGPSTLLAITSPVHPFKVRCVQQPYSRHHLQRGGTHAAGAMAARRLYRFRGCAARRGGGRTGQAQPIVRTSPAPTCQGPLQLQDVWKGVSMRVSDPGGWWRIDELEPDTQVRPSTARRRTSLVRPSTARRGTRLIDLQGRKFGRLTVLALSRCLPNEREAYWHCYCECGNETRVRGSSLRAKVTASCGCYRREAFRELRLILSGREPTNV